MMNDECKDQYFYNFVTHNFTKAKKYYCVDVGKPDHQKSVFLLDDQSRVYVVQVHNFEYRDSTQWKAEPYAIFLPSYNELADTITYILEKILPKIKPHLFPDVDYKYLSEPQFIPVEIANLIEEREKLKRSYEEEAKRIEDKVEQVKREKHYLTNILSKKEELLQEAVGRMIQEIFEMIGFDLKVFDVDKDDDMKNEDRRHTIMCQIKICKIFKHIQRPF